MIILYIELDNLFISATLAPTGIGQTKRTTGKHREKN